jgi:hypothetical protein
MTDLLTRSVTAVAKHPDAGHADVENLVRRHRRRTAKRKAIGGASLAAVLAIGAMTVTRKINESRFVTANGAIDAGGLAMDGNAGDFYELNPSVVPAGWQRELNRDWIKLGVCLTVEDRNGRPVCTETEGPAGVGQVDYAPPGNSSNASAGNPSDDASAQALSVVTTHTSVGVDAYVERWQSMSDNPTAADVVDTTVRGHPARAYRPNGKETSAVTWLEAPGLVVTVTGLNVEQALVNSVAEAITVVDVRRLPMPVVAARAAGITWTAIDNNHPYLLVQHKDGDECAGYDFIDGCSQTMAVRTKVISTANGFTTLGKTAENVTSADALASDGTVLASAPTTSLVGFSSRFFSIATGDTPPATIVARNANGGVVERLKLNDAPLRPSKLPEVFDGVKVAILANAFVPGPDVPRLRLSYVPARTVTATNGTKVAVDNCFVVETLDASSAWCGKLDRPIALQSEDAVAVLTPPGWTTVPGLNGGYDPSYNNGMPDDQFVPFGFLLTKAGQVVTATAPGSDKPVTIAPEAPITFEQLTAAQTKLVVKV